MRKWRKFYFVMLLAAESTLASAGSAAVDGLFKYHKTLASQGDPISMYLLGNMYANGKGVARNYDTALHWYELSLQSGDSDNRATLQRIDEIVKKKQAAEKRKTKQDSAKSRKYVKDNKPSKGRGEIKEKTNRHQADKINTAVSTQPLSKGASGIKDIPQLTSEGQLIEKVRSKDEQKQSDADGIVRPGVALIEPSTPELSAPVLSDVTSSSQADTPESGEAATPSEADIPAPAPAPVTPAKISANLEAKNETLRQGAETNKQSPVVPTEVQDTKQEKAGFKANPCSGPAAQFMSTCN